MRSTIILVILPIFIPTASALGIYLVHFGNIVSAISEAPLRHIIRDSMPFVYAMVIALIIITYVPETVLWLPKLMGYKG